MKTFEEFICEAGHSFKAGDVVEVRWHDTTGSVSHGTTNIDKASGSYAHARHPNIPGLMIKVHQGSGKETGHSAVRGHYALHPVNQSVSEGFVVGKPGTHVHQIDPKKHYVIDFDGGPGLANPWKIHSSHDTREAAKKVADKIDHDAKSGQQLLHSFPEHFKK